MKFECMYCGRIEDKLPQPSYTSVKACPQQPGHLTRCFMKPVTEATASVEKQSWWRRLLKK